MTMLVLVPGLCPSPGARADEVEATIRQYSADSVFPAKDFSADTTPGARARKTQLRLAGQQTLWDGILADYDLRWSSAYRSDRRSGMRIASSSSGLEDQKIGIRHSFGRWGGVSNAARLAVVIPGGADRLTPSLGSGQWAVEPTWFFGFDPGFAGLHVGFDIGSRVFLDGGSAQLRTHFQVSAPVSERLRLGAEVTYRRSMLFGAYRAPRDDGELSNILRPGMSAQYELADGLETVMAWQIYAAGMDERAYQRVIIGLAVTY